MKGIFSFTYRLFVAGLLCVPIMFCACLDRQCFESFYFSFETENSLVSEEISVGDSFSIEIRIPDMALSTDGISHDISDLDFVTAMTFKEYVSPVQEIGGQDPAMDDFAYTFAQGQEIPPTGAVLTWNTASHSVFCLPASSPGGRIIKVFVTPQKEGTFFLFFQSANAISQESGVDFDGDDCIDSVFFGYTNVTRNNYAFLEGAIQAPGNYQGDFLDNWSGIAFKVVE